VKIDNNIYQRKVLWEKTNMRGNYAFSTEMKHRQHATCSPVHSVVRNMFCTTDRFKSWH